MIDLKEIPKLSKNIFIRYEQNIDDGTLFIYNFENEFLWTGNEDSYNIIKYIDNKSTIEDICIILSEIYENTILEDIQEGVISTIQEFTSNKFVRF